MRLLVVDDHQPTLSFLGPLLGARGYDVTCAATGTEALALAAGQRFDLVVLDVGLADMDGLEVCRELRRGRRYLPVLFVTGRDKLADELACYAAQGDGYVTKPIHPDLLVARIEATLRTAGQRRGGEPIRLIGDIEIDRPLRCVRRGGRPARLRPRAFDLLVFFAEHPGRVWGVTELLTAVWPGPDQPDANAVTWQVSAIRRALEDNPNEPRLLLTRPHVGYLMPREVLR